ncbi:MAG TPA: type II toxin-antitoxin system PemK/MazF family toxin [Gammaproteobacteria bacterium]
MKRGEIWSVAGGADYAGRPRPVVILQDNRFAELLSVTICPFTTNPTSAPLFRLPIAATESNGLAASCSLMVDKIMTVPKTKVGARIGRLGDTDLMRLNRAIVVFLGLAGASAQD